MMKNKSGSWLSLETAIIIVISALCIVLIALVLFKIGGILIKDSDLTKSEKELNKISGFVSYSWAKEDGFRTETIVYPVFGWVLKSYSNDFPKDSNCQQKKSCLCFCNDEECLKLRTCKGFDFVVRIDNSYYKKEIMPGYMMAPIATEKTQALKFEVSMAGLIITKNNTAVIITENKNGS
jgi:hypothetical protein